MNIVRRAAFICWRQGTTELFHPTTYQVQQRWQNICCLNRVLNVAPSQCFHTGATSLQRRRWEKKNNVKYPPQKPGEPPRMAEVYHCRRQIKYSKDKMWYIATFIKGMMIDEALMQLDHINMKGAKIAKEVLLEAQDMAVKEHNVEFRSNLHIAESFSSKGDYEKAIRIHAKGRYGIMDINYSHYYVCLKEGPPPKEVVVTGYDQAKEYVDGLRNRTIIHGL
ncbi:39S ribosomal protein L22, mitochondrial-like [Anneissia japonica]|uniref:39S ribosomal protein L22, mitochondrial-like n=1 Tax=Anneissia japonica TaxID=1529436 RepID=UPI00142586A7|nr:39S ribosomal protein L22, mitochondrial-like [Anneissia japonica]